MLAARLLRRKKLNGERGQSLTEFALIIPIFLLLVFAIVDFGMGFHAWITITNSAREGARLGAVGGSSTQITQRVRDTSGCLSGSGLDCAQMGVTVTNAQGTPGSSVQVNVTYTYKFITPLAGIVHIVSGGSLGSQLNLSSSAQMRLE